MELKQSRSLALGSVVFLLVQCVVCGVEVRIVAVNGSDVDLLHVEAEVGDNVTLRCEVRGMTTDNPVTWDRLGDDIQASDRFTLREEPLEIRGDTTTDKALILTISSVGVQDTTRYCCQVRQENAESDSVIAGARTQLTVFSVPVCSPSGPITAFSGDYKTINCTTSEGTHTLGNTFVVRNTDVSGEISIVANESRTYETLTWLEVQNQTGLFFRCVITSQYYPGRDRSCTIGPITVLERPVTTTVTPLPTIPAITTVLPTETAGPAGLSTSSPGTSAAHGGTLHPSEVSVTLSLAPSERQSWDYSPMPTSESPFTTVETLSQIPTTGFSSFATSVDTDGDTTTPERSNDATSTVTLVPSQTPSSEYSSPQTTSLSVTASDHHSTTEPAISNDVFISSQISTGPTWPSDPPTTASSDSLEPDRSTTIVVDASSPWPVSEIGGDSPGEVQTVPTDEATSSEGSPNPTTTPLNSVTSSTPGPAESIATTPTLRPSASDSNTRQTLPSTAADYATVASTVPSSPAETKTTSQDGDRQTASTDSTSTSPAEEPTESSPYAISLAHRSTVKPLPATTEDVESSPRKTKPAKVSKTWPPTTTLNRMNNPVVQPCLNPLSPEVWFIVAVVVAAIALNFFVIAVVLGLKVMRMSRYSWNMSSDAILSRNEYCRRQVELNGIENRSFTDIPMKGICDGHM